MVTSLECLDSEDAMASGTREVVHSASAEGGTTDNLLLVIGNGFFMNGRSFLKKKILKMQEQKQNLLEAAHCPKSTDGKQGRHGKRYSRAALSAQILSRRQMELGHAERGLSSCAELGLRPALLGQNETFSQRRV